MWFIVTIISISFNSHNPKLFTSVEFRKLNTEVPSGRNCFQREESTKKTGRSSFIPVIEMLEANKVNL